MRLTKSYYKLAFTTKKKVTPYSKNYPFQNITDFGRQTHMGRKAKPLPFILPLKNASSAPHTSKY
jgi:hypothetical protein